MSPNPTSASKRSELLGRLTGATWSRAIDDLLLGRIARDAKGLMTLDPAGAHMALGGIAAARGDVVATRRHYEVAIRLDDSHATKLNYSVALSLVGEHEEALVVASAMLRDHPDDISLLDHAVNQAVESAAFAEAERLCLHRARIAPTRANPMAKEVPQVVAAIAAGRFTASGVRELLRGVSDIQRRAGLRQTSIGMTSDLDGESFLYARGVNTTPDEVAALNEQIAEFAVDHLMDDPGSRFVAAFKASEFDGRHA